MLTYTETQIEAMKAIGREWQKDGKHRIYFNELRTLYHGLELTYYKNGRTISDAFLDGKRISNRKAGEITGRLAGCSAYYDLTLARLVMVDRYSKLLPEDIERVRAGIEAAIAAVEQGQATE